MTNKNGNLGVVAEALEASWAKPTLSPLAPALNYVGRHIPHDVAVFASAEVRKTDTGPALNLWVFTKAIAVHVTAHSDPNGLAEAVYTSRGWWPTDRIELTFTTSDTPEPLYAHVTAPNREPLPIYSPPLVKPETEPGTNVTTTGGKVNDLVQVLTHSTRCTCG